MNNEKDEDLVDVGFLVLVEAAREFEKTGKPAFSYPIAEPEKLIERERTNEEKEFAKRSCYDTAR